jgi:hypothetical protein
MLTKVTENFQKEIEPPRRQPRPKTRVSTVTAGPPDFTEHFESGQRIWASKGVQVFAGTHLWLGTNALHCLAFPLFRPPDAVSVGHFGGGSGRSTPITGLISGKPDRGSLGPILLQKSASGTWGATIESERASSWVKVTHQRLILNHSMLLTRMPKIFLQQYRPVTGMVRQPQPPCHAAEEAGRTGALKAKRAVRLVVPY